MRTTVSRSSLSRCSHIRSAASAVDFWALGVCLYQFLVGVTPFSDECPRAIISNILNYRILWPEDDDELDDDAVRVIKGLLSYEPSLRLQLDGKPPMRLSDRHNTL